MFENIQKYAAFMKGYFFIKSSLKCLLLFESILIEKKTKDMGYPSLTKTISTCIAKNTRRAKKQTFFFCCSTSQSKIEAFNTEQFFFTRLNV